MQIPALQPWLEPPLLQWIGWVLDSYAHWTGQELVDRTGSSRDQANRVFHAPFVVVSHGAECDPILNFGNAQALRLWEMSWEKFTSTPSRLTAEPFSQADRAHMLERAATEGIIRDYQGVRISNTGKRFLVEKATVWNVMDHHQQRVGQAATFSSWTLL